MERYVIEMNQYQQDYIYTLQDRRFQANQKDDIVKVETPHFMETTFSWGFLLIV